MSILYCYSCKSSSGQSEINIFALLSCGLICMAICNQCMTQCTTFSLFYFIALLQAAKQQQQKEKRKEIESTYMGIRIPMHNLRKGKILSTT